MAAIGLVNAFFLATVFLRKPAIDRTANRLLAFLFLLVAIRLGKVIVQSSDLATLKALYFNLMHAGFLSLGPTLWLFQKTLGTSNERRRARQLIHFVPALLLLVGASSIRLQVTQPTWLRIYELILISPLPYLFLVFRQLFVQKAQRHQKSWLSYGAIMVGLIWLMNVLYYWFAFPFYIVTGALVTLLFYMVLIGLIKPNKFKTEKKSKYSNLRLTSEQAKLIFNQVEKIMIEESLFMEPGLKLQTVAQQLNLSSHRISGAINMMAGVGFSEYINQQRIEAAKKLLVTNKDLKIIAIAMEVGFSSLSTFNAAFKKSQDLTPSDYRSRHRN